MIPGERRHFGSVRIAEEQPQANCTHHVGHGVGNRHCGAVAGLRHGFLNCHRQHIQELCQHAGHGHCGRAHVHAGGRKQGRHQYPLDHG